MSDIKQMPNNTFHTILTTFLWLAGGFFLIAGVMVGSLVLASPTGSAIIGNLKSLLAIDSVQTMWYITRSAGITAYILLWLSTAWGLAVSSKILDRILHRSFTYDFHQYISLLAIGFIFLHVIVLMLDRYLPFSLVQILVPFTSSYRPVWIGIGIIGFYLTLLVSVTFYMRTIIGQKTFRTIHVLSLVAYLGTTIHGFFAGTDTPLITVAGMYVITFLIIVFLLAYWVISLSLKKRAAKPQARLENPARSRLYR
jgi:sulfoxide reductase heme-binding subunit YedZ